MSVAIKDGLESPTSQVAQVNYKLRTTNYEFLMLACRTDCHLTHYLTDVRYANKEIVNCRNLPN